MEKILALDLGGTKIYSALVDREGRILREDLRPTIAEDGFSSVVERIIASLHQVLSAECGAPPLGIGAAVPAYIDPKTDMIVFSPNLKWQDVDLKRKIEDSLGLPVWLDNDANLAALGEHRYGAGKGFQDMIYITVSTGVGGGLILGGEIFRGAFGGAGEFGHMVVDAHGPECSCNNRGCLEGLASGCAITRAAQKKAKFRGGAPIFDFVDCIEGIDARVVGQAALLGDEEAREILATAGYSLGLAIANVANLLNPEAFIIGGGVACGVGEYILGPARSAAEQHIYPPYRGFLKILPAALGSRSGVLGAAAYAWDRVGDGGLPGVKDFD